MRGDRSKQILYTGLQAASERMLAHPSRPDYPQDFDKLYGWLEDKVFNLYEAIALKKLSYIRKMAGEVIVTASEIAELSDKIAITKYTKKQKIIAEGGNGGKETEKKKISRD